MSPPITHSLKRLLKHNCQTIYITVNAATDNLLFSISLSFFMQTKRERDRLCKEEEYPESVGKGMLVAKQSHLKPTQMPPG